MATMQDKSERTFFRVYAAKKSAEGLYDFMLMAEDDDMGYIAQQYIQAETNGLVAQMFMVTEVEELLG
jgi:hypothetical protein